MTSIIIVILHNVTLFFCFWSHNNFDEEWLELRNILGGILNLKLIKLKIEIRSILTKKPKIQSTTEFLLYIVRLPSIDILYQTKG